MEGIESLINTFRRTGGVILIGLLLIIYVAFGFVYWQQGSQQDTLDQQIAKITPVLAKPLPSVANLQTEYNKVNEALVPMTDKDTIAMLVGIAQQSGIDVNPAEKKLVVPAAAFSKVKVGGGNYEVMSFKGITAQGSYDDIMAFISDLDSGKTLPNMVLAKVDTAEAKIMFEGAEKVRRDEFRNVIAAVKDMMKDNALSAIPKPMNFAGGVAGNLTGDDPETEGVFEGFPDITTTSTQKGYVGLGSPRDGYVLYQHDKIPAENNTEFVTVSYLNTLTTLYYYTCEADGTVRQFDKADLATATEYLGTEDYKLETVATVGVDIYIRPRK